MPQRLCFDRALHVEPFGHLIRWSFREDATLSTAIAPDYLILQDGEPRVTRAAAALVNSPVHQQLRHAMAPDHMTELTVSSHLKKDQKPFCMWSDIANSVLDICIV